MYSNSPCKNTHISDSKQAFFIFLAIFFQLKNAISFIISLFSNFYYVYNYPWDVSFLSTKRWIIMQFFLFYFWKKEHPKTILSGKTEKTQQNGIKMYEATKLAKSAKGCLHYEKQNQSLPPLAASSSLDHFTQYIYGYVSALHFAIPPPLPTRIFFTY